MKQSVVKQKILVALCLIGSQCVILPLKAQSSVAETVKRQEALDQARRSAVPQFKWGGPTITFKSRCFSDVCLGDDVTKLSNLKVTWLEDQWVSPNKLDQERRVREQQRRRSPEMLQLVDAAFRGLNQAEQGTIASNRLALGQGSGPDYSAYQVFVPVGIDHIVISTVSFRQGCVRRV